MKFGFLILREPNKLRDIGFILWPFLCTGNLLVSDFYWIPSPICNFSIHTAN